MDEKKDRVLLYLCADLEPYLELADKDKKQYTSLNRSTIIVADSTYNGIYFPLDELEKAYRLFDGKPININHSDDIKDEVGYVRDPQFEDKRLTVTPVLNPATSEYGVAEGYINNRLAAGQTPEVSVGVWVTRDVELDDNGEVVRTVARNVIPDHLAIVSRGACSPMDGCGIGLRRDEENIIPVFSPPFFTTSTWTTNTTDVFFDGEADEKLRLKKDILKEKIRIEGGK